MKCQAIVTLVLFSLVYVSANPVLVDPVPVDPVLVDPVPVDPVLGDPVPIDPVLVDPVPPMKWKPLDPIICIFPSPF
ncbi:peroxisome proliferator-activated receptor gamma coactivator-related protein 1-like isoform X2 [Bradysia coprophila]|uniref:peroxisome proliferator-activated receptor gamma coactivator-related protein 1-like isoform X2 n=1 Tax=Bradysia coprophila TaxID=38358 RepID=UPI00187D79A4|nr:peroxisome proliferator-activated receptor gamma coactivator-related protein 1-like isoform X2 [Bradysia coprophila]